MNAAVRTYCALAFGGLTAAVVLPSMLAQAPAPAATANEPADPELVVQLSPFEVSASSDHGYVASESMTGSRVATKIIDLPYTVNVLTNEFFEDFALFELADNLVHVGSFTGLDIGGGFTLRGFGSTSQLRDGFYRLGRYGSSNVDRMEIIKGSNAAIYGRTSPGGMVNMISKMPRDEDYYKLSVNVGDYHTRRATLEATGKLLTSRLGSTSYILTASFYEKGFDIPFSLNRNNEYYLALRHTFKDNSTLTFQGEYFLQHRNSPNSSAPLVIDLKGTAANTDDEAIGYAKNLAGYNAFGPDSQLDRGNNSFTLTYDKKLSSVFSARVSANHYLARRWDYNQNTSFGSISINPSNGAAPTTARGATPNRGLIFEDGGGLQADLLAHYWTGNRKVEHRTLVTFDYNDYDRWDPTWNYAVSGNPDLVAWNAVRTITLNAATLTPTAPIQYFEHPFNEATSVHSRLTRRRTTVFGGLLRHQSAFFDGRLLTYAGARFDAVRFKERDYLTSVNSFRAFPGYENYQLGDLILKRVDQLKPNLGVNFKVTPALRAYVNYSESYFVNQTDNPITFADPTYKPEIADGYDYGFKGTFLEDRLNFTVGGFYAVRENVSVSDTFESPVGSGNYVTQNRRDGDQLVRGFEADLNWRVNDQVTVGGSYGNVYSIYTDFGSAFPLAVGRRVNNVSPENGSAYMKWAPGGRWRGFSVNLGVTHVAATPTEAPNAGDTYTTTAKGQRVLTRTTRQWALRVPSFTQWNLGVRYALPRKSGVDQTLAVNVNNLFDVDYLKVNRQLGERRAVFFTYTIGFAADQR